MRKAETPLFPKSLVCAPMRIRHDIRFLPIALVLAVSFLLLPYTAAQLYTGSISGTVTDPSGAVIPSAHIDATDQDKGFAFMATTDASGRYLLRPVPPGKYRMSVDASNFQGQRKEAVTVEVNQSVSVDFSLHVGAANQVVDVEAGAVQLQTQDAVTGQVVDRRLINNLPLINRDFLSLAYLAPGVTDVDSQCVGCLANNFVSNGSRGATADILLDGASATNFEQNSGIVAPTYLPSVEAVEEFKVQQSNFSAEYGFSGATVINVITRSGTNQFHGSAYDFLRNDKLDANDWFNNFNAQPRQPLRRNNFGTTFGGPLRKNKTFFFFDYDGNREHDFASANAGVPTALERTGDFGELCTLRGAGFDGAGQCSDPAGQLWDPYSSDPTLGVPVRSTFIPFNNLATFQSAGNPKLAGSPFQPTAAPGNLIDPVALKLMQMFPNPTQSAGTFSDLASNWFGSGISLTSNNQFDIKVDNRFSERDLLSVKYSQQWGNSHGFDCFKNPSDPCTGGPTDSTAHLVAINETHTFAPNLLLNVSYGFTRGFTFEKGIQGDFPGLDPVNDLGMPAYMDRSGFPQYPEIIITGYNPAGGNGNNIGTQTFSYLREGTDTHQLLGAVNWVRGPHEFKFGAEGRLHRINFAQPGWPAGEFQFDFSGSSQAVTGDPSDGGDGMASFLMGMGPMTSPQPGICDSGCPYEVPNTVSTQSFQFAGFVQDNYRLTPKLTVNLGLRYEVNLPRTERFNRMNWLDPTLVSPFQVPGVPELHGGEVFAGSSNRYNYNTDYRNWQPRFGFAYQFTNNLVLRGGYGIYFSTPRSGAAGTGPWGYQGFDQQTPWIPTFNNDGVTPGARLSDPFRSSAAPFNDVGPKLPPGNSLGALNDIGFGAVGPIPSISQNTPYEQAWSFGFQESLPGKIVMDASYVGKKGTHLYYGGFREYNRLGPAVEKLTTAQIADLATTQVPNPFFGFITDPLSALSGPTIPKFMDPTNPIHVPFPQFTNFDGDSPPIASSIYHALQVRVEKEYKNGLQFLMTYTWSHSIDNTSVTDDSISWLGGGLPGGNTFAPQDPNNLGPERSTSAFDTPHVLQFSYVYELPIGRGKKLGGGMNPVADAVIGGWQLNGILRFDDGRPILPHLQDIQNPIPTYSQRPNMDGVLRRNGNANAWVNGDPSQGYFANPEIFSQPADYTLGNAPRTVTSVRTAGTRNVTMSLFKQFSLARYREGMRFEFRLEAFNAFNHPQFDAPDTAVGSSTFGKIFNTANHAREAQVALKFYF